MWYSKTRMNSYRVLKVINVTPHPSHICVPQIETPTKSLDVEQTNMFSLGEALQSYYPLLELIFKYLDRKSLKSVKLVNSVWKDKAQIELEKRIWPSWMSFMNACQTCLLYSEGFNYNNVALGLVVYDPSLTPLNRSLCLHDNDSAKAKKITVMNYVNKVISETKLQYCILASPSIDSTFSTQTIEGETAFQGVFIPFIPHIRTIMFEVNPKTPQVLSSLIKTEEEVKGCLIFSKRYRGIEPLLCALLNGRHPKEVAVGGGILCGRKSLIMPEKQKLCEQHIFCVTFLQSKREDANFNAYSTVILNEKEDIASFTEELIKFKESTILRKHGIVFRFCCSAKTWKSRETEIITYHFPHFTIFGMDVEGEIGWNTFDTDNYEASKNKKRKANLPQYLNGWSTVLVLVTWGE